MRYKQLIVGSVVGIIITGALCFEYPNLFGHKNNATVSLENHEGGGRLTNPLLECLGEGDAGPMSSLNISRFDLNKTVEKIINSGKVGSMSVYIRDMNNGPWIGINEKEEFIGASLLKVPVLISYMKLAEDDPSILDKKIEYKIKLNAEDQYFNPSKEIVVGNTYTVRELMEYMIKYSDNNAADLLVTELNQNQINSVFKAIGAGFPDTN